MLSFISLSYSMMALLYDADPQLDLAQDELLEWLKKTELIFDRLLKRFQRIYPQLLIYAVIFYNLFSEFPNGMRHLCTTMPWTIWPALVVLWGVCWMFYPDLVPNEVVGVEQLAPLDQQRQISDAQDRLGDDMSMSIPSPISALLDGIPVTTTTTYDGSFVYQPSHIEPITFSCLDDALLNTSSDAAAYMSDENLFMDESNLDLFSLLTSSCLPFEACYQSQPAMSPREHTTSNTVLPSELEPAMPGSFQCTDCNKKFSRLDSLKRHRKELHIRDAGNFLCPYPDCKKSRKGYGFKRRDKWLVHQSKSCKSRLRAISGNRNTTPSTAVRQLGVDVHRDNIPVEETDSTIEPDCARLQNKDIIVELPCATTQHHNVILKDSHGMRLRITFGPTAQSESDRHDSLSINIGPTTRSMQIAFNP
ncbi:hypothetical protein V8C37DRAFT_251405 [Trichoderma ceciliae]